MPGGKSEPAGRRTQSPPTPRRLSERAGVATVRATRTRDDDSRRQPRRAPDPAMSLPPDPSPAAASSPAGLKRDESGAVLRVELPDLPVIRGKVRDVFDLSSRPGGEGLLLICASDRLSAFDHVLPTGIPGKGRILTSLSNWWFDFLDVPDHRSDAAAARFLPSDLSDADRVDLLARSVVARRCRMLPVECVARGYLSGSGWAEYRAGGAVCGAPNCRRGWTESARLPEPDLHPGRQGDGPGTTRTCLTTAWSAKTVGDPKRLEPAAGSHAGRCTAGPPPGRRSACLTPAGGHEVRVRRRRWGVGRRPAEALRRSAHAGQFALLAAVGVRRRRTTAQLRQTVRERLVARKRLGSRKPAPAAAEGDRGTNRGEVPGGTSPSHRRRRGLNPGPWHFATATRIW